MRSPWLIAAVLLAAVAAGCSREEAPVAPKAGESAQLAFWHIMHYSGPREVLQSAVDRFEAAHPNAKVTVESFENDQFKRKLAVEMAGGRPPDVFHTWGGGVLTAYARAGKVMDLAAALDRDGWRGTFNPTALRFCSFEGRVYAVPLDIAVAPLWYNRKLFAEHNLTPPRTYAELLAVGEKLKAADITPLALGNKDQWPGAFYFIYLAARLGGAELFIKAAAGEGATFADPAFVEAGRRVQEMVKRGMFSEGFNGLSADQARTRFFTGRAAMYLMGNWLVQRCANEAPDFMADLDCIPFPTVAGGKGEAGTIVGGTNAAFAVSATCAHPDLAVALLRELTGPAVVKGWVTEAKRLPAVSCGGGTSDLPKPAQRALELLREAPKIQLYYDQYLSPRLATAHKETTQALFAGAMTPEKAAQTMAAEAAAEAGR